MEVTVLKFILASCIGVMSSTGAKTVPEVVRVVSDEGQHWIVETKTGYPKVQVIDSNRCLVKKAKEVRQ